MTILRFFVFSFVLLFPSVSLGQTESPPLLQSPTLSEGQIVFVYADDLWLVGRQGGQAIRLTSGEGVESNPALSPDGKLVAFTGNYDGNTDVFLVPAAGGVPKRLTFHPVSDRVRGWTPDGRQVLFASSRNSYSRFERLYTVSLDGGLPVEVPLPLAFQGCYLSDGQKMAYVPLPGAFQTWKRYRGGMASTIWIADLEDSSVDKIPHEGWNDFNPMWVDDKVYFLSDREGSVTLYAYEVASGEVEPVIENQGLDIKSASAGPRGIVYEQFGEIHILDLRSRRSQRVNIQVAGDLPSVRSRFVEVDEEIQYANLSPTGARAVFGARGEILTVPAEKGDVRNLTNTSGVAERDPAWSPDGQPIAYFSDESGEYALHLREQTVTGDTRKIDLGQPPSYFYSPVWSPDSKKIAYSDKRLNLWVLDIAQGNPVMVDTGPYDSPFRSLDPVWSPDSQWIAYTKRLQNHLHAVFVYDVAKTKSEQITDGLSDARYPAFDKGGKYLYFTASTNVGPTTAWLDMFSINRPVNRSVYLVVLKKDEPSPLAPESDEEEGKEKGSEEDQHDKGDQDTDEDGGVEDAEEEKDKENVKVEIDFEDIDQRILALPVPAENYIGLATGAEGTLFLTEIGQIPTFGPGSTTVQKFTLKERKSEQLIEGIDAFVLSHDGKKMLVRQGDQWAIHATKSKPEAGKGVLKLGGMEVRVDPKAEWKQMYKEVWRIQRDFLYDPGAHGLDLASAERRYEPYLDSVASRTDLNYLFSEMLGNLVLGHVYVGGGDFPEVKDVPVGLLGADYGLEDGRYRFSRVYRGENWNPDLRAPLTEPGVDVQEGEYLLAVNGQTVSVSDNVYRYFENSAGKSVILKVGPNPDGSNARDVTVVPVASERTLRHRAWIDENRRKVSEWSGGRVGYVYLPNTAGAGFTNFNRYYFAQVGKHAIVLDERFNGGGLVANYIIDTMRRPLASYWTTREGQDFSTPANAIFGPKAMIINEFAGSGGDWMPWYFRKAELGPLVGKRTWGGLVGIYDYPPLIDGGRVTAPRMAFWNPNGSWEIENYGVAPDVQVEFDPDAWRKGEDPQLKRAVEWVLEELERNPPEPHQKPAYPNYYRDQRQP
jgi:tricorn protease